MNEKRKQRLEIAFKKPQKRNSKRAFPKEHYKSFRCGTYLVSTETPPKSDVSNDQWEND